MQEHSGNKRTEIVQETRENIAIDIGKLVATFFIIMIHCSPTADEVSLVFRGGYLEDRSSFLFCECGFFSEQ